MPRKMSLGGKGPNKHKRQKGINSLLSAAVMLSQSCVPRQPTHSLIRFVCVRMQAEAARERKKRKENLEEEDPKAKAPSCM